MISTGSYRRFSYQFLKCETASLGIKNLSAIGEAENFHDMEHRAVVEIRVNFETVDTSRSR